MTLRDMPEGADLRAGKNVHWDAPSDVLARWADWPLAAAESDTGISIYEPIGFDPWTGQGVTVARVDAALRKIGNRAVTVRINSPGGDMLQGVAIYNALRKHPAKVTVEVMGIAASAASVIAMAGDEVRMGLGTLMMVHNAWGVVVGNRLELLEAAATFDKFDAAMADIYQARTGLKRSEIVALMDRETFMTADEAVKFAFADKVDNEIAARAADPKNLDASLRARRQTESALARAGYNREERAKILVEAKMVTPAAGFPQPPARDELFEAGLTRIINTLRT